MSSLAMVIPMDDCLELESHKFIKYFEFKEARKLCEIAKIEKFSDQEIVFNEGDTPDYLYLILKGKIEFRKKTKSHQYQVIATAKTNDYFGEFSILDGQPRSACAVAIKTVKLAKISRYHLLESLKAARGNVTLKLFSKMTQYLRATTDQYVNQVVHKEKMETIGEMVSTILHDFRSPFTGIQLASAMMKEAHSDEDTQEWCNLISMQIQRMLNMAEEVLEFSKGSATLEFSPVKFRHLMQKFEKLNRIYFQSHQVNFSWDIQGEIVIQADEDKLIRVLQNLIINAIEAFEKPAGTIRVIGIPYDNWAEITIIDDGPGIPENIQDQLFEAFVTHGKRSGTGLGTTIVKSIIEAHGGEIKFQSIPNQGTTFKICLPLAQSQINMISHRVSDTIQLQ